MLTSAVPVPARRVNEGIEIVVADDGMGFVDRGDAGVGLTNLRERLAAHFGARARLTIDDLSPGTAVRLTIPAA